MDLGLTPDALRAGLIFFLALFAVLILRAFAQAWVANFFGDPTPGADGRVTLNPGPHIDILGTIVLPLLCIFFIQPRMGQAAFFLAWTAPLMINESAMRNPRRDGLLTQFAPTAMCVLLALLVAVLGAVIYRFDPRVIALVSTLIGICSMLIVLDCLPVPPLPGGRLLHHFGLISEEAYWSIASWSGFALMLLFSVPQVRFFLGAITMRVMYPFAAVFDLLIR